MKAKFITSLLGGLGLCAALLAQPATAAVTGLTGTVFDLTAKQGYLSTADGFQHYSWGYANSATGKVQWPGPTLIVNQGDSVTVHLRSQMPVTPITTDAATNLRPVSIVFPGQLVATPGCGSANQGSMGEVTCEATHVNDVVTYTFTAGQPGTYAYYSGSDMALQNEMGLYGTLIVRPTGFTDGSANTQGIDTTGTLGAPLQANANRRAYGHAASQYDREHLFVLSELDPFIHFMLDPLYGPPEPVDLSQRWPTYFLINGRVGPDTVLPDNVPYMPYQPYSALPQMHPGEKMLMRVVSAGFDPHPFHHHMNHVWEIARDGRLLSSNGTEPDLAIKNFTQQPAPGSTSDLIFQWTARAIGWDIYGPKDSWPAGFKGRPLDGLGNPQPWAYETWCATPNHPDCDVGRAFPVDLPNPLDITFGPHYSGSPFLGLSEPLPPGNTVQNPWNAYMNMWHSHAEKELTNDGIFPGGMLTMLVVQHPSVFIP
jgi:FtsP/CotA-like multicopper oxidase with cupredoxin domain